MTVEEELRGSNVLNKIKQDTNDDQDLLWLVDKENPDRKYYVQGLNSEHFRMPLITARVIPLDGSVYYYGYGATNVEAITNAVREALRGEARRAEAKAAIDKYGE